MASLRVLACGGYHHGRVAAYGLHSESFWSSVICGEPGPTSSPQFPGSKLRFPFHMVRVWLLWSTRKSRTPSRTSASVFPSACISCDTDVVQNSLLCSMATNMLGLCKYAFLECSASLAYSLLYVQPRVPFLFWLVFAVAFHFGDRLPSGLVRPWRSRWAGGIFERCRACHGTIPVTVRHADSKVLIFGSTLRQSPRLWEVRWQVCFVYSSWITKLTINH